MDIFTNYGIKGMIFADHNTGMPFAASQAVNSISFSGKVGQTGIMGNDGLMQDSAPDNMDQSWSCELRELNPINSFIAGAGDTAEEFDALTGKALSIGRTPHGFAQSISISGNDTSIRAELIISAISATEVEVFDTLRAVNTKLQFSVGKHVVTPGQPTVIDLTGTHGITVTIGSDYVIKAEDAANLSVMPAGTRAITAGVGGDGLKLKRVRVTAISETTGNGDIFICVFHKVSFDTPLEVSLTNKEIGTQNISGLALTKSATDREIYRFTQLKAE